MFTVISVPFASTCVQPLYVVSVFIVFWIFCVLFVALFCWRSLYIVHSFLVNVFVFIDVYIHCKYEWIIFILKATLSDHVTDQWYFSFDDFVCFCFLIPINVSKLCGIICCFKFLSWNKLLSDFNVNRISIYITVKLLL